MAILHCGWLPQFKTSRTPSPFGRAPDEANVLLYETEMETV